ncbi:unnamed protein product [Haemonchus placei]|uniref:Uncharacterized protein n=1 Tax=Haemonchus placei TaxID=6290 RepID=A0A0N4WIA8_HAEPC|nr:unnamed protein product [Haemonchus placei]
MNRTRISGVREKTSIQRLRFIHYTQRMISFYLDGFHLKAGYFLSLSVIQISYNMGTNAPT